MCGIFGYIKTETSPALTPEQFTALWKENMFRGKDASGIGYLHHGRMVVKKHNSSAEKFFPALEMRDVYTSPLVMMHVRAKTKGSETKQENNHPVVGMDHVVIHNGMVTNDDEVWEHFGETRFAEVDSSVINLVLAKKGLAGLGLLGGGASLVAWSATDREKLILARFGTNPFWLFSPQPGVLIWSSDPDVYKFFPSSHAGQVPMFSFGELPDKTALVVGLDGRITTYDLTMSPIQMKPRVTPMTHLLPAHYLPASQHPTEVALGRRPFVDGGSGGGKPNTTRRPAPMFDHVSCPSPTLIETLEKLGHGKPQKVKTIYGTWWLTNEPGGYTTAFKPNKDMARWAGREEFDWWNGEGDAEVLRFLANRRPLEISARPDLGRHMVFCPWCGISRTPDAWVHDHRECEYCGIIAAVHVIGQGD